MMPSRASRGVLARINPLRRGGLMANGGLSVVGRPVLRLPGFGLVLLGLLAWLGVVAVLGGVVLLMLKGVALLATFIWVGVTASPNDTRGRSGWASAAEVGYGLAGEVARKPLLMILVILGLGLTNTVWFIILAVAALTGMSAVFGVRKVRAWLDARAIRRSGRAEFTHGADASNVPRGVTWRFGGRGKIPAASDWPECGGRPVELHIRVSLASRVDVNAATDLSLQALITMRQTLKEPAPVCLKRSCVGGGALLDLRFHVLDLRRGKEHLLSDARSNLWDVFHQHRIAFGFQPDERGHSDIAAT
jgi:hypothetical protein